MQPTQEQIKRFWRWCGFKQAITVTGVLVWIAPDKVYPDIDTDIDLDLNNLFKYAVPKLQPEVIKIVPVTEVKTQFDYGQKWACHLTLKGWDKTKAVISDSSDPALALFWAIWEIIKESE